MKDKINKLMNLYRSNPNCPEGISAYNKAKQLIEKSGHKDCLNDIVVYKPKESLPVVISNDLKVYEKRKPKRKILEKAISKGLIFTTEVAMMTAKGIGESFKDIFVHDKPPIYVGDEPRIKTRTTYTSTTTNTVVHETY